MASSYDIQTYLLDKSNIEDTIHKQVLYYDLQYAEGLEEEVYTSECVIDYTAMFGGEPITFKSREWAEDVTNLIKKFDHAQHYASGVVVRLPQPGPKAVRPSTVTAIGNGGAHMVRQAAEGGPITHNGGRAEYEVVRVPELEEKGENPWRIRVQKIIPIWADGNLRVMEVMSESKIMPK
ncbi:hypothetical protein PFICI_13697 [Pestalotiopsis fici W106-1]|uniref:SnoaL-like domain-containing protein n=1 Tax=Pestalotiopsis fici (strain W106-1 / CGMCC3.15140) TaxID=1229662 RepID=W3WMX9_PESFW|nr:uncharacterized protein PFICI_13697 [Pestalotiopsis fici W106-1]ETS75213.1 hypothetical protein PFICI_13697 [Pestalotiopsis fici W106-1]